MKNKDYYLLFPVEVSRRELLAKLYLGLKGARRNYRVIIGEHARPIFKKITSGFLLYKDHAPWSRDYLFRLRRNGLNVGCLDEEGLIFKSEDTYRRTRCSPEVFTYLDAVFLWGCKQKEVIEDMLLDDGNVYCVGNPRIDVFNALKNIRISKHDYKNILVNTRFTSCNGFRGKAELTNLKKLKIVSNEQEYKEYEEFISKDRNIFEGFLELIYKLSENCQNQITIRPHPSECIDIYTNIAANKKNVLVDNATELVNQINSNNIIIHDGCTTAIEASAAGKIVLGFRPVESDLNYGHFPNKFSRNFDNLDDLVRYIEKNCPGQHHREIDDKEARNFIANWNLRDQNSSNSILDVIDQFRARSLRNVNGHKANLLFFRGDGLRYLFHLFLMRTWFSPILKVIFGERFKEYHKNIQLNEHKFPPLTKARIRESIDLLCSLDASLGNPQDYRVEMIGKKAFLLFDDNL